MNFNLLLIIFISLISLTFQSSECMKNYNQCLVRCERGNRRVDIYQSCVGACKNQRHACLWAQ